MQLTEQKYTRVAIWLHWIIAALIITDLIIGLYFPEPLPGEKFSKKPLLWLHISIGITVLMLSIARLAWRLWRPPPPHRADMARWEQRAATLTHAAFYGLMIGIPLSGWLMISAHKTFPFKNMIWGIIEWPIMPFFRDLPVAQVEAWHHLFEVIHEALGEYMLIALLLLHLAAVVKHHVIDKDPVLLRMLPFRQRPAPE